MKELQFLTNALDAAIKAGVYNLQEAGQILQAINALGNQLQQKDASVPAPIAKEEDLDKLPLKKPAKK